MGGKYSVLAKNYDDMAWHSLYTNSRFKALRFWLKALMKYELIEFTVRK